MCPKPHSGRESGSVPNRNTSLTLGTVVLQIPLEAPAESHLEFEGLEGADPAV